MQVGHARVQLKQAVKASAVPWWLRWPLSQFVTKIVKTPDDVCKVARGLRLILEVVSKYTAWEGDDKATQVLRDVEKFVC